MVFGLPGKEQMTLNHDRLFRKKIVKDIRTAHLIPKMRELIFQGKHAEADRFFLENMGVHEGITNPYQVFCALQFNLRLSDESWDYERSLDLSSGIARIAFRSGGRRYSYEGFVSEPEQALFVRVVLDDESADDHSGMDCDLVLSRVPDEDCVLRVQYKEAQMILTGEFVEGVRFATLTEVNCSGGSVSCEKNRLIIRGAKEIFLCQVFATSYTADDPSEDCVRQLESTLVADCSGQPLCDRYENHKTLHITENKRLFDRMDFQLDGADSNRSSEESYSDIEKNQCIGQELYVWLFNMGRYCLLSSSRPGSSPMNLQGVWNDRIDPLFESGYTTDMNIQMQYWAALPLNLSECVLPVFQWLQDSEEILRKQAKSILGTRGYYVPQYTDIHFTPASQVPYAMFQLLWVGAASWLGQHFFEYWKFTGDDRFARDCAYPYLKQCAEAFTDWLVRDFDGKYRSVPSYSPENMTAFGSWSVNTSTMDITIIRELFSHLRQLDHALQLCDPDREWWDAVENNLPDYPFDKTSYKMSIGIFR
jgi:alpha-L-fucosidase 2